MLKNTFDTLYSRLNTYQKSAVEAIEGPIMVIAGPGTGKTTILTLRIANILKKTDTPAHGILAITYTDAGVKAMREKLSGIIGNRAHDIHIHTFHSFASSIIAEFPEHFIEISDMKQFDEEGIGQEIIIRNILNDTKFNDLTPLGKPDMYIRSIISAISEAKKNNMSPDMVEAYAKKEIKNIEEDEDNISTRGVTKGKLKAEALNKIEKCQKTVLFSSVYAKYEEEKKKAERLDFDDLIIELLKKLRENELLLRLVQEQFLYIHIDEHQDTNDSQNFIISIIAEFFDTPNIFIVGDEKQAIYRFQGASVENFMLLQKKWPSMKMISLDTNYRSHQNILDASFSMIENNYEEDEYKELRIKLKGEKAKDKIKLIIGENTKAIELYLIEELKNILKNEKDSNIAIITRKNKELDRIIELLESHHLPVSSERSIDIFHNPIGILFFDLIEYIADPSKTDLLAKTLISGLWNIEFDKSIEIIKLIKSGKDIKIEKVIPAIVDIKEKLLIENSLGSLIYIAEKSDFIKIISRDPSYIHVWRGIISLAESLVQSGDIHGPLELINSMLAYRLSAENRTIKITVGAPDVPIKAMTAHGSKGLEFDYVFMPYAVEEAWIGKNRRPSFVLPRKQADQNDITDLRRLFYVALTRAKKNVYIMPSLEESNGDILTPLRFISEIDDKYIEKITLSREDTKTIVEKSKTNENEMKILHLAKNVLMEKGLSVTALNHFLECPNKFIYQSILKLPQAPTPSGEKGSAMHDAISQIWKNNINGVKNIEQTLVESINNYLNNSMLSIKEKESVKKELMEMVGDIAKSLESHFNLKGKIYTEHWVKMLYKDIPIHGKLDAIVDMTDEVKVFDYKTKQTMSDNAIKGDTKSSNGEYFRQLIFYKMLLSNDFHFREKRISPYLVFLSPDNKGRCDIKSLNIEKEDIDRVKGEIDTLIKSVWNGEILKGSCGEKDCEWCKMRKLL